MKKVFAAVLCLVLVLGTSMTAFAEMGTQDDWVAYSQVNSALTVMDGKIKIANVGKDAWVGTFGSSKLVDPDGFTWEFSVSDAKKFKGQDGFDLWYGLGLNGKTDTLASPGFYALVKPVGENETEFAFFALGNNVQKEYDVIKISGDYKQKWTLQLKKNGNAWEVYVNGKKQEIKLKGATDDLSVLTEGFNSLNQGGKAYPYLGIWSQPPFDGMTAVLTVTRMETVKETSTAGNDAPATEETGSAATASPKTADVSILPFVLTACVSGAAVFARKKILK